MLGSNLLKQRTQGSVPYTSIGVPPGVVNEEPKTGSSTGLSTGVKILLGVIIAALIVTLVLGSVAIARLDNGFSTPSLVTNRLFVSESANFPLPPSAKKRNMMHKRVDGGDEPILVIDGSVEIMG